MAFDRQGFTTAAKAMGYSDDEINSIATMKETQTSSPANELKGVQLQQAQLNLQQDQLEADKLKDDPYGIKEAEAVATSKARMDDLKNIKVKSTFNQQNVQNAKDILDLLNKKNSGLIDDTSYNTQLNLLASRQAAHIGFGIGGKVLSEGEKAILQPQMANLAKSKTTEKGNIFERIGGFVSGSPVPQIERSKELLQDTPEELRAKMLATIQTYGIDSDKVKYLQSQSQQSGAAPQQQISQVPQAKGGWKGFTGNPVENLANEGVDAIKGLGTALVTKHPDRGLLSAFDLSKTLPEVGNMGVDLGKSLARTAGFGVKPDGSISWNPVDIARHAWNQPLETLMWASMVKAPKVGKGALTGGELPAIETGQIAKNIAKKGKGGIESTLEATTGGGTKELIAKNLMKDQAQSLNKTLLDHDIYKYTDKGRIEATQRALIDEGSIMQKKFLASKGELSSVVLDKQVDQIMLRNGITDPNVAGQIKESLTSAGVYDLPSNTSMVSDYQLWEMAKRADEFGPKAFNMPTIGPQMKGVTKDLSRYLRGYLHESVPTVTENMRAYANLKTYMDDILKDPAGLHAKGAMSLMNVMANTANAMVGKPLEVASQKAYNILDKISPEARTAAPSASINSLPPVGAQPQGFTRQPLPETTMQNIIKNKSNKYPAQSSRLLRDKRYSEFTPRKGQEDLLRSMSKGKYK